MRARSGFLLCLAMAVAPSLALGHHAGDEQRLPTIGPAPDFSLTSQDGATVALRGFAGRILAVAFIYTSCTDICPLLADKMAQVQDELGPDFGTPSDAVPPAPRALPDNRLCSRSRPCGVTLGSQVDLSRPDTRRRAQGR